MTGNINYQVHCGELEAALLVKLPYSKTVAINKDKYDKVVGLVTGSMPDAVAKPIEFKETKSFCIEGETFAARIRRVEYDFHISFFAKNFDILRSCIELIRPYIINKQESDVEISCYSWVKESIFTRYMDFDKNVLENIFPEFYPDVDISELIRVYSESREKILILYGSPGTGKTTFIKSLLSEFGGRNIAYCKCLRVLGADDFWNSLQENDVDLLILDDLDIALTRQSGEAKEIVNKLLSFTDGVIGNKTKIIITTNQDLKTIDPAIIRPGRCLDVIELLPLSKEEALSVWTETLGNTEETFSFTDRDKVTQAELMKLHEDIMAKNRVRSYIKKGDTKNYLISDKLKQKDVNVSDEKYNGGSVGFNAK